MGGTMYSLMIYNYGIASLLTGLVQRYYIESIGYGTMFYALAGLSVLSLLMNFTVFQEKSKWTELDVE
jgi:hypothetical protein